MKVTIEQVVTKTENVYTIVLSQEEAELLQRMSWFNSSIPEFLRDRIPSLPRDKMSTLLSELYAQLRDATPTNKIGG